MPAAEPIEAEGSSPRPRDHIRREIVGRPVGFRDDGHWRESWSECQCSMAAGSWMMDVREVEGESGEGEQLGRTIDMNENPLQIGHERIQ